mgnify:CR=1 FL=1
MLREETEALARMNDNMDGGRRVASPQLDDIPEIALDSEIGSRPPQPLNNFVRGSRGGRGARGRGARGGRIRANRSRRPGQPNPVIERTQELLDN